MKKLIALTIALALSLTMLAACGGDDNGTSSSTPTQRDTATPDNSHNDTQPTPTPPEDTTDSGNGDNGGLPGGQAMASLIAWMMDGKYSYDFDMTTDGPEGKTEGSGSWAQDGDNFMVRQEMTVDGMNVKSWIIQKDGAMYMIDEDSKFIMEMGAEMNMTEGMVTDYTDIALIGTGTGEINERTLPYEEYSDGEFGATVKYYLDGDDVYGIETEYDGYKTVMIIKNASGSVPANAFDLPSGYTTMDMSGGLNLDDLLSGIKLP